jgi:signal peptidase II
MRSKYVWLTAVALVVIAADQWTKYLVLGRLTTGLDQAESRIGVFYGTAPEAVGLEGTHFRTKDQVVLSTDFLRLRYAENPGAAFGLFHNVAPEYRGPLFHLVSIGAVLLIGYYFLKLTGAKNEVWAKWGLPLVLGGALGNYLDRLARGFVIDFIDAHWFEKATWPAFNVADSAIVVGVGLLLVDSFVRKEVKAPASAPVATAP